MKNKKISFTTYNNQMMELDLFEQDSKTLVIFFPGHSYTKLAPLIFYGNNQAKELLFDTLVLEYPFQLNNSDFNFDNYNLLLDDLKKLIKNIYKNYSYEKLVFIGKSLGTLFQNDLSNYFSEFNIYNVFLTPLRGILNKLSNSPSLFIFGGNDPHFSIDDFNSICRKVDLLYFKNANHSLNSDNTIDSIEILNETTKGIKKFLREINLN